MNPGRWLSRHRARIAEEARGISKTLVWVLVFYLGGLVSLNLLSTSWGSNFAFLFPHVAPSGSLSENSLDQAWGLIQGEYLFRGISGNLGTQAAEQSFIDLLHNKYGDRFSALLSPAEFSSFSESLNSQRQGSIGVALEARCGNGVVCPTGQQPTVVAFEDVLIGQPADRAGIRNGDLLTAVNGKPLAALGANFNARFNAVPGLIRGQAGTQVQITVTRAGRTLQFTVTRENLNVPSVYSKMLGRDLYVQITGMNSDTPGLLRQQLQAGLSHGAMAVILDLRENPGGLTSTAQAVVSQFVAPGGGRQDVYVGRGRLASSARPDTAQFVEHVPLLQGGVATKVPVVILVNGDTASAAEITTAALHDYHRALVIGTKTFGKGSVVRDYPLPDGYVVHLVVERWYGPAGENIDVAGISPDKTVPLTNPDMRFRLDSRAPAPGSDTQLQAAENALG